MSDSIVSDEHYVVKRKHRRKCHLCGHGFRVGDRARRAVWHQDGRLVAWAEHSACEAVAALDWVEGDVYDLDDRDSRAEALRALRAERTKGDS